MIVTVLLLHQRIAVEFEILKVSIFSVLRLGLMGHNPHKSAPPHGPFDFIDHQRALGRSARLYRGTCSKLTLDKQSLRCRLPAVWNTLPESLRNIQEKEKFKAELVKLPRKEQIVLLAIAELLALMYVLFTNFWSGKL